MTGGRNFPIVILGEAMILAIVTLLPIISPLRMLPLGLAYA